MAIGHNRYATSGGTGEIYNQPFLHDAGRFAWRTTANFPDCARSCILAGHDIPTESQNDTRPMEAAIAYYVGRAQDLASAIAKAYPVVHRSFFGPFYGCDQIGSVPRRVWYQASVDWKT